jgi:protease-4
MLKHVAAVTLLASAVALADSPATRPAATRPATQQASTRPATQPAARIKLPTPAELMAKFKGERETVAAKMQVAAFMLNSEFTEKPADFSLFGGPSPTLRDLLERIGKARDDATLKAVLLYVGSGTGLNLSQAQEVRDALGELRRAGKKTFVYADSFDTTSYVLASAATNVCLLPGGEVFIPGIGFDTTFFKGTLDKIGVQADYVQIGEYKGAEEPFTRVQPSEELKGEMNKLVDAYYKQIIEGISLHRNLSGDRVKQAVDGAIIPAVQAKTEGYVDHLVDADGLRELMKNELGGEVNLQHEYGTSQRDAVDLSNPFAIFKLMNARPAAGTKPKIAIVYAQGTIVDGEGGAGLTGGSSVGSEEIRRAMRMAGRDEQVKAVVIRIDSPGGSALASEAMWQAVRHVAEDKPVVISIGSMAASGGYYLASAGDYIVADPAAIVGSIGVVGGKFVTTELYEKLGITTMTFARGQNASLFSSAQPFDDRQRRMVRTWMKNTYDQFTQRILTTRSDRIKDIDQVARGRIFLAADAKALGMVDALGGMNMAIAEAAERAELETGEFDTVAVPAPTTLGDLLNGREGGEAAAPVRPAMVLPEAARSLLAPLPREVRIAIGRQVELMHILEKRPVALMSPFVITTR